MFLKIGVLKNFQNSQENICTGIFFIKNFIAVSQPVTFF